MTADAFSAKVTDEKEQESEKTIVDKATGGGKVRVNTDKQYHVILVNQRDDKKAAFINMRYGQAASLALSVMSTALLMLFAN